MIESYNIKKIDHNQKEILNKDRTIDLIEIKIITTIKDSIIIKEIIILEIIILEIIIKEVIPIHNKKEAIINNKEIIINGLKKVIIKLNKFINNLEINNLRIK